MVKGISGMSLHQQVVLFEAARRLQRQVHQAQRKIKKNQHHTLRYNELHFFDTYLSLVLTQLEPSIHANSNRTKIGEMKKQMRATEIGTAIARLEEFLPTAKQRAQRNIEELTLRRSQLERNLVRKQEVRRRRKNLRRP